MCRHGRQKVQVLFTTKALKLLDELDNNVPKIAWKLGVEQNNIYMWIKQRDSIMAQYEIEMLIRGENWEKVFSELDVQLVLCAREREYLKTSPLQVKW